ncbi:MAG: hypothetical protein JWQ32_596 [Marmoricola sp.]|nr:hypothetical protein [Marmoricola sp.]
MHGTALAVWLTGVVLLLGAILWLLIAPAELKALGGGLVACAVGLQQYAERIRRRAVGRKPKTQLAEDTIGR